MDQIFYNRERYQYELLNVSEDNYSTIQIQQQFEDNTYTSDAS